MIPDVRGLDNFKNKLANLDQGQLEEIVIGLLKGGGSFVMFSDFAKMEDHASPMIAGPSVTSFGLGSRTITHFRGAELPYGTNLKEVAAAVQDGRFAIKRSNDKTLRMSEGFRECLKQHMASAPPSTPTSTATPTLTPALRALLGLEDDENIGDLDADLLQFILDLMKTLTDANEQAAEAERGVSGGARASDGGFKVGITASSGASTTSRSSGTSQADAIRDAAAAITQNYTKRAQAQLKRKQSKRDDIREEDKDRAKADAKKSAKKADEARADVPPNPTGLPPANG